MGNSRYKFFANCAKQVSWSRWFWLANTSPKCVYYWSNCPYIFHRICHTTSIIRHL